MAKGRKVKIIQYSFVLAKTQRAPKYLNIAKIGYVLPK